MCVCVCIYCANNNQIKFLTRMYNTCTCCYEHQHTLHKKKDDVLFTYKNVLHYLSTLYRNNCHYQKTVNYFHIKSNKKKKTLK